MEWPIRLIAMIIMLGTAGGVAVASMRKEWGAAFARFLFGMVAFFVISDFDTLRGWFEDVLGDGGAPSKPADSQPQDGDWPSWLPLALTAGGLAASFGLYGLGNLVRRRRARRAARRAADVAAQTRRTAIEAEHDEVRDEYAAYLCDVLAVLDRPALDDVTIPLTAAFLHAMDTADDARRGSDLDIYRPAVSELKTAWRAADEHARKTGVRHLPKPERAAIGKARALLAQALDGAGGEHERHTAYAKARELLDGILVIPRQAAAELETRHRLTLTKAES